MKIPPHILEIKRFECRKCGECCRGTVAYISYSDIERWKQEGRWNILEEVSFVEWDRGKGFVFYKTVPKDSVCPFLSSKNLCSIYDTRPKVCRNFPYNASTEEQLAKCEGVGKGKRVKRKVLELLSRDERKDLLKTATHAQEVMRTIIFARGMTGMIENGLVEFDATTGKYELTDKGRKDMERHEERLRQKASESGKTIEEVRREEESKSMREIMKKRIVRGEEIRRGR